MKKIMKTKLILQTFATALLFLLLGCRTELETELGKNIPNENQNRISFSQFKNETRTKDLKQNFLTLAKNAKISSKENQVPFIFIIDTLNINRLDFDKKTTYSFRAYNIFENPDKRYNLVYFYKNDKWNFSILELLANNKSKPIYDSRFGEIIEAQNTQSGRVCLMAYTSYSFHCTHTGSCASGVCDGCDLCVTRTSGYVYADCGGLNGSGDDGSGTGNPGDSGGGTSNASQDPSGYTYDPYIEPNTDPEYVRAVRASNYWQQVAVIGNGASQWANEHPDLYCNILENYLNNYSTTNNTNNLNFANWGIGFLAENTVNGVCNISWTQFQPMLNFAQEFLSKNPDTTSPDQIFNRLKSLDDLLNTNPNILLDIPCSQLPYWQELANHQIPQQVKDKLKTVNSNSHWYNSDLEIQNLDYSKSYTINMDVYPVKITNLPNKPGTNQKYTPSELFNYFRLNINKFTDASHGQFFPVVDSTIGINDTALWNSTNPLSSLITIKIPLDEGTVMCSGYNSQAWIFTTVKSPWDGEHPVSGNRLFGYYMDGNDMYIYTRGIDRFTSTYSTPDVIRELENIGYSKASEMWKNMQNLLNNFVKNNNGSSQVLPGVDYIPNYIFVKEYLKGQRSISTLGCH